jgi:hypothetical protein
MNKKETQRLITWTIGNGKFGKKLVDLLHPAHEEIAQQKNNNNEDNETNPLTYIPVHTYGNPCRTPEHS